MVAECAHCDGTGYVVDESGPAAVARRCRCQAHVRGDVDLTAAGMPRRYLHCTLDNYRPVDATQRLARDTARAFVEGYPAHDRGLMFIGSVGCGKTHLAAAILRQLVLDQGLAACFVDYLDLLKRIQATFTRGGDPERRSEWDVLQPVLECDLLVLDDLGARRGSPWEQETVDHLLTVRYNEQRTTLVTTNLIDVDTEGQPHDELPGDNVALAKRVSERVLSRLHEMCRIVRLVGVDHRRRHA